MLQRPDLLDAVDLDAKHFEHERHRQIWQAIKALATEGEGVDVLTVHNRLRRFSPTDTTIAPYLAELVELTTTTAHAEHHAALVREAAARRKMRALAVRLSEDTGDAPIAPLLEQAEAALRDIQRTAGAKGIVGDPQLGPLAAAKDEMEPAPVLWRDMDDQHAQAVLSIGEVALLSGEGGLGKSFLTLALASAATSAQDLSMEHGAACGLRVMPGPAVLVSYEDSPARLYNRLRRLGNTALAAGIHVARNPEPLWTAGGYGGGSGPTNWWESLWRYVRDNQARLVVIDPASAALADAAVGETGPVRRFLRALTLEAEQASCGLLVVSHSTKAARNLLRAGDDPGAGVVAGSAAWYDAARGILTLSECPDNPEARILECVKANYGKRGWGALLHERTAKGGSFGGLEFRNRPSNRLDRVPKQKPASGKRNGKTADTSFEFGENVRNYRKGQE